MVTALFITHEDEEVLFDSRTYILFVLWGDMPTGHPTQMISALPTLFPV